MKPGDDSPLKSAFVVHFDVMKYVILSVRCVFDEGGVNCFPVEKFSRINVVRLSSPIVLLLAHI